MAYSHTKFQDGISGLFDPNGNSEINMTKCIKISLDHSQFADTSEVVIHEPLPRCLVEKVIIDVKTKENTGSTKTIDIGTATADSGDPNGFIAAASVAAVAAIKGAGALVGKICPASDRIVATAPNAFSEFVADVYIFYVEV